MKNGGQSVGNEDRSPVSGSFKKGILDQDLGDCVHAGRCLVKDYYLWVVQDDPGKWDKLAFA